MTDWKRIEPTEVTKVGWRTVTSKTFQMPNGEQATFDTFHADGQEFACVIALTPDSKVIIGSEYCPGPEMYMHELPGGFVDAGEDPPRLPYAASLVKKRVISLGIYGTWVLFAKTNI